MGSHPRVQGCVLILTCRCREGVPPREAASALPSRPQLNEGHATSTSQWRAPFLLISLHLAPRAGVCRAQGLSAYITLVPFGRMKNLPGVYCKQAYVHPNTERKGQRIIHAPLSPRPALSTPHQLQTRLPTPTSGRWPGPVPNLSTRPSEAQGPVTGTRANLAALML